MKWVLYFPAENKANINCHLSRKMKWALHFPQENEVNIIFIFSTENEVNVICYNVILGIGMFFCL